MRVIARWYPIIAGGVVLFLGLGGYGALMRLLAGQW